MADLSTQELQTLIVRLGHDTASKVYPSVSGAKLKRAKKTLLALVAVNELYEALPEPVSVWRTQIASACRLCGREMPAGSRVAWMTHRGAACVACWELIK